MPARHMQQQQQQQCRHASAVAARRQMVVKPTHVVSVAAPEVAPKQQAAGAKEWYALVANAEFFCNDPQNESIAEQLRERVRFHQEHNLDTDFYLVPNPKWLDAKFPEKAKQVKRPCMALVTTDKQWMIFMKVRLDRVMKLELTGMSEDEVMQAGEPLPEFKWVQPPTSPYARYTPGWWKVFYPSGAN